MSDLYILGCSVLAGDSDEPAGTAFHVKSVNTPIYAANMMGPDTPPADLGEPVTTLQMGDLVEALGPSVNNPKGAPFTPVKVRGRDGVFWIRSTSIAENAPLTQAQAKRGPMQKSQKSESGFKWWYGLLAAGGVLVVGTTAYAALK